MLYIYRKSAKSLAGRYPHDEATKTPLFRDNYFVSLRELKVVVACNDRDTFLFVSVKVDIRLHRDSDSEVAAVVRANPRA